MGEPVTHDQLNKIIQDSTVEMKKFIESKFTEHERVETLMNKSIMDNVAAVDKSCTEVRKEVYGNGKAGLKTIVDRLWQDHSSTLWWLRGVGLTVVGKIIFDIITK